MKPFGIRATLISFALFSSAAAASAAPVRFVASLTGAQETPPTGSSAAGSAQLFVDPGTGDYQLELSTTGLEEDVTAIHIHDGAVGNVCWNA